MRLAGRPPAPATEQTAAGAFLARVRGAWEEAAPRAPVVPVRVGVAGRMVELRIAGEALRAALTPALAHLRADDPRRPDLTIRAWDGESSGVPLPPPPWDVAHLTARREMWGVRDGPFQALHEFADGARLSILDERAGEALFWTPSAGGLAMYERAAPFLRILHWWLRGQDLQLTHGAVVGGADGGILIGGRSGAGKSTTALACVAAGLGWAGDDYVAIAAGSPPVAHSLFGVAKLEEDHLGRVLPELLPTVTNPEGTAWEKAVVAPELRYPGRLVREAPIRAVVLPVLTGGHATRLVEVSPVRGIAAIAPSTLFQLRWTGPEEYEAIAAAVRAVPNYRLEVGDDLGAVGEVVAALLARTGP